MDFDLATFKAKLIAKAMAEPNFRAELLASPAAALERLTGMPAPAGLDLQVVQETPTRLYLVLPGQPAAGELSEQDLGQVTGGCKSWLGICQDTVRPPGTV